MSDFYSEATGFPAAEVAPATTLGTHTHTLSLSPSFRYVRLDGSDFHGFIAARLAHQRARYILLKQSH